ncbi:hypothetical protein A2662_01070 [Candidatus Giovannonibacteria bacterium RIFCSPHIGHO2_01_FULL_45_33]|uniref:Uncharacterized protein n=1 Tax=Candidatus Giovannonibacteria bacterium RIFCSPLOWO2_01_FULL_45_34 TaxID=1798351 RepID=A0A1F5WZY5_9BACT|nr:MAG: hypothetical protein A2662_01070 [Candidatus Giovannonibacteria bacterium RIFCSPHIGHO2_01_FULL_45_33]OGF81204.1 MAG: hypothetical protein A2930_00395 [Candidatus Giovannonibacteria bacterium RIFCSPLOWO2_01_FULL_45_34]
MFVAKGFINSLSLDGKKLFCIVSAIAVWLIAIFMVIMSISYDGPHGPTMAGRIFVSIVFPLMAILLTLGIIPIVRTINCLKRNDSSGASS